MHIYQSFDVYFQDHFGRTMRKRVFQAYADIEGLNQTNMRPRWPKLASLVHKKKHDPLAVYSSSVVVLYLCVRFALVWFCLFPLPLGVWGGLRFVIMALPGPFSKLFFSSE